MAKMKVQDMVVSQPGLKRCCMASLWEFLELCDPEDEIETMSTLDCKYEGPGNENMYLDEHGVWRWNRHQGENASLPFEKVVTKQQ